MKPGDLVVVRDMATLWYGPDPRPWVDNSPAWSFAHGNTLALVFARLSLEEMRLDNYKEIYGIIIDDQIRWVMGDYMEYP